MFIETGPLLLNKLRRSGMTKVVDQQTTINTARLPQLLAALLALAHSPWAMPQSAQPVIALKAPPIPEAYPPTLPAPAPAGPRDTSPTAPVPQPRAGWHTQKLCPRNSAVEAPPRMAEHRFAAGHARRARYPLPSREPRATLRWGWRLCDNETQAQSVNHRLSCVSPPDHPRAGPMNGGQLGLGPFSWMAVVVAG